MTISASGVRIQGDDYQHLYTWYQALRLLSPGSDVTAVSVEAVDAGNVDDVVVHRSSGSDEYVQVKYSKDGQHPIDAAWWTTSAKPGAKTPLEAFWGSWQQLRARGVAPTMKLFTNRSIDTTDAVLTLRCGQRGLLVPGLRDATPRSAAGKGRKEWAKHLGIDEVALLEMCDHLELLVDQGPSSGLAERVSDKMAALRLLHDGSAVEQGVAAVRSWVKGAKRRVGPDDLAAELDQRKLRGKDAYATLLVDGIDRDPWPDSAVVRLDWVDLFVGDDPRERRQLKEPRLWNERLRPDVVKAAQTLKTRGFDRVLVRGFMRLPTWFLVGAELPDVRGHHVACRQRDDVWSSDTVPAILIIRSSRLRLSDAKELAVGISVTHNIGNDVVAYLKAGSPTVGEYLDLAPDAGASPGAIMDAAHAVGWARATREALMQIVRELKPTAIHLFLSGPAGCALLLGHGWNRMPPTQVYEDLGAGRGYAPSFRLPG